MKTTRKFPKQERAKTTVNSILEAANQLIESEGLENVSTNKIAERAGVSIGSLYQFFPNKAVIFETLAAYNIEKVANEAEGIIGSLMSSPPLDVAEALLDMIFSASRSNKALISMTLKFYLQEQSNDAIQSLQDKIIAVGREYLLANKEILNFEDAHTTAYVQVNTCILLLCHFLAQKQTFVTESQLKKEIITMLNSRLMIA